MPATWVPCWQALTGPGHGAAAPTPKDSEAPPAQFDVYLDPDVVEKHASASTSDAPSVARNGWSRATPVSRTATTCPVPSSPCDHSWSACTDTGEFVDWIVLMPSSPTPTTGPA